MTDQERLAILERHVNQLAEIYDHVQVMGSWLTPDNRTRSHRRGSGNWYARQGLAHEFIEENIAEDQAIAIAKQLNPPDEWAGVGG